MLLSISMLQATSSVNRDFWRDRPVFVSGHTGFKGGWLATWLVDMGAEVTGYSLPPDSEPSFFAVCGLAGRMHSIFADVRDQARLAKAMRDCQPAIVFHLAAQPLVLRSYQEPAATFATNVMGTVNLLEAVRATSSVCATVVITSDKCYQNREWLWGYREHDPMGGHDPYSASKGCAELVTAAYQRSFFVGGSAHVASARAGNVIGGGDWAENRLVPDAIRALSRGEPLILRNPGSVRPWQHVLEPLAGYLRLAERLSDQSSEYVGAWNFGPREEDMMTVATLAERVVKRWGSGTWQAAESPQTNHEAHYLKLDCSKARKILDWHPLLSVDEAVSMTVDWYRAAADHASEMYGFTIEQIRAYHSHLVK